MQDEAGEVMEASYAAAADDASRSAVAVHRGVFTEPTVDRQWVGALIEAAANVASGRTAWKEMTLFTEWDERLPDNTQAADSKKHEAYAAYMAGVINERMPWLPPLLSAAGATLLVAPGLCTLSLPHLPGEYSDIRELWPYSLLLPWVTAEDKQLMQ